MYVILFTEDDVKHPGAFLDAKRRERLQRPSARNRENNPAAGPVGKDGGAKAADRAVGP
jgi:hypothetical protein